MSGLRSESTRRIGGSSFAGGRPTSSTARLALVVWALGTALLVVLDAFVRDAPAARGDDLIYELMARDPLATHTFPFAYRILVPWLVWALPFETTLSFSVLAWTFSGAAGAVLLLLLEHLGMPRRVSVPLALLLVVSPPLLVNSIRQGRGIDPASVLVMTAGALFIARRQPRALAATVLVGALNREAALFLVPWAYAVWAERLIDRRVLARVAAVAAPAVVAYATLRLAIPTVGRESVPGYSGSLTGRLDVVFNRLGYLPVEARRIFLSYGPLWFVAPLALRDFSFARRGLVLVPLIVASMTFALDWGRLVFIGAPLVYAASAWVLRARPRLQVPVLASWAALVLVYAVYMQLVGVDNIIATGPSPYPVR